MNRIRNLITSIKIAWVKWVLSKTADLDTLVDYRIKLERQHPTDLDAAQRLGRLYQIIDELIADRMEAEGWFAGLDEIFYDEAD